MRSSGVLLGSARQADANDRIGPLKPLPQVSRWRTELTVKGAPQSAFRSEASLAGDLSQLHLRRLQEGAGKLTADPLDGLGRRYPAGSHELPMKAAGWLTNR
jgi:hypothetical protein